jgi:organic radical activating enzyme
MHAVAAMGRGHVRQPVGRLEREGLGDLHRCLRDARWRLSLQTHKLIGIP